MTWHTLAVFALSSGRRNVAERVIRVTQNGNIKWEKTICTRVLAYRSPFISLLTFITCGTLPCPPLFIVIGIVESTQNSSYIQYYLIVSL